jgi:Holliday junction resolvasome RuvABC DNA-binding subunit
MLYTYMNVREDAMELFGFASKGELSTFKMLIGITGVGPKVALAILSELSSEQIAMCVSSGDSKTLTRANGVGPKLALSVLSTFTPAALATVVATQDASRMAQVAGVGKKKAQRLLVELEGVFQKDAELRGLVGLSQPAPEDAPRPSSTSVELEATEALLSMGFTQQEAELALQGHEEAGASTIEKVLSFALRNLGGGA